MAKIGNVNATGFIVDPGADGVVAANKFTAASTFTPDKIRVQFQDSFGAAGTVYAAVYADNAGAPGAKLFNGSTAYASLFNGIKDIAVTGSELTNTTPYWLAVLFDSSGTFNIDIDAENSSTNQAVKSWTETPGSWTDSPTLGTDLAADRDIAIETTDEASTTTSTTTTSTSSSTTTTSTTTTRSTSTTTTSTSTTRSTSTTTTSTSTTTTRSTSTSSTSTTTTVSLTTSTTTTSTSTSTTTTSTTTTRSTSSSTSSSTSTSITTTSTSTSTSSTSTSTSSSTSTTQTFPFFLNVGLA